MSDDSNAASPIDPVRLAAQISDDVAAATRRSFDEVADAVQTLSRTVDDVARRIQLTEAGQAEGDARWEQRITGIEERLVRLDESLRLEIDRVRSSAQVLDLLAGEFRQTIGTTHDLATTTGQLAEHIGHLEASAAAASHAAIMINELHRRFDELEAAIANADDSSVSEAIDAGLAPTTQSLQTISNRLGGLETSTSGQRDELGDLRSQLGAISQALGTLNVIRDEIGVEVRTVHESVVELRDRAGDPTAVLDRLASLVDRLDRTDETISVLADATRTDSTSHRVLLETVAGEVTAAHAAIANVAAARSGDADVTEAMTNRLDGLATSLQVLSSERQALDEQLAQLAERLESSMARVGEEIDRSVAERDDRSAALLREVATRDDSTAVAELLGPVRSSLDELVAERNDLTTALADLAARTEAAIVANRDALAERLADLSAVQTTAAAELTNDIARAVNEAGAARSEVIALRTGIDHVDAVAAELGDRATAIEAALGDMSGRMTPWLDQVTSAVADLRGELSGTRGSLESLGALGTAVNARLATVAERVDALSEPTDDPRFDELRTTLQGELAQVQQLLTSVTDRDATTRDDLLGGLAALERTIEAQAQRTAALDGEVIERVSSLRDSVDEFTNGPNQLGDAILPALATHHDELRSVVHEAVDRAIAQGDAQRTATSADLLALREKLNALQPAITDELRAIANPTEASLAELSTMLESMQTELGRSNTELSSTIESAVTSIVGRLAPLTDLPDLSDLVNDVHERMEGLDVARLSAQLSDLEGQVGQVVTDLRQVAADVNGRLDEASDDAGRHADRVVTSLDGLGEAVRTNDWSELTTQLESMAARLEATAASTSSELTTQLGELGGRFERIDFSAIEASIASGNASIAQQFGSAMGRLDEVRGRVDELDTNTGRRSDQQHVALTGAIEAITAVRGLVEAIELDGVLAAVDRSSARLSTELGSLLDQAALANRELLNEISGEQTAAIDQGLGHVAAELREQSTTNRGMVDSLGMQVSSLHAALSQQSVEQSTVRTQLDSALEQLAERLGAAMREVRAEVAGSGDDSGEIIRSAVEAGLERMVRSVNTDVGRILTALSAQDESVSDRLRRVDSTLTDIRRELEVIRRTAGRGESLSPS